MKRKFWLITTTLVLIIGLASACTGMIPVTDTQNTATQDAYVVQSALSTATMIALQNQISTLQTQVAQGTPAAAPTLAAPTATLLPSATQQPTATLVVLPTATATPIPVPCNAAQFIEDVSVPDGSTLYPGTTFTKIWRLKNVGTCTWTTSYDLVFMKGDQMDGDDVVGMPGNVAPGQVVDVLVDLIAPEDSGSYRGYWTLRDASGVLFGLGRTNSTFYVDIKVETPQSNDPLNFVSSACQAEWTSGAGRLPCQGENSDSRGYVRRIDNPTLESGYVDDEPALVTHPQMISDGVIRGKYPSIRVKQGYTFVSVIGCANKAEKCDVIFRLDYQIGSGSIHNLGTWYEEYDEQFNQVEVDLDELEGKDVKFILTVQANGSSSGDHAQWLMPHIEKAK